jgi:hypothetical protein
VRAPVRLIQCVSSPSGNIEPHRQCPLSTHSCRDSFDPLRTLASRANPRSMRAAARLMWLISTLLTGACDRSAMAGSESLVGAKSLPSARDLAGEEIQINRRGGPHDDHVLTYDLSPSNSLTVAHSVDQLGGEKTVATAAFQLTPEVANHVRTLLWRVRPERLTDIRDITLPTGCSVVVDASPQANVVFIGRKQRVGISSIPRERVCDTPQAKQARRLVSGVLGLLPGSSVPARFPT